MLAPSCQRRRESFSRVIVVLVGPESLLCVSNAPGTFVRSFNVDMSVARVDDVVAAPEIPQRGMASFSR